METFIGQISSEVERKDNRWHFSLFNEKTAKEIECVSSMKFEVENKDLELILKPKVFVKVYGSQPLPGQFLFDRFEIPKSAY